MSYNFNDKNGRRTERCLRLYSYYTACGKVAILFVMSANGGTFNF